MNTSDLHTKNLEKTLFDKHAKVHVGDDEYFYDPKNNFTAANNSEVRRSVGE